MTWLNHEVTREMLKQLEFVCDSSYPSLTLYIRLITHNIVNEILDRKS